MPNPCYAIYLTCDPDVLDDIDKYIEYAKIHEDQRLCRQHHGRHVHRLSIRRYTRNIRRRRISTRTTRSRNTRRVIQKIKDAGFYAIGRLTTFNDSFFCQDHPEYAIADGAGDPLYVAAQLLAERLLPLRVGVQGRAGEWTRSRPWASTRSSSTMSVSRTARMTMKRPATIDYPQRDTTRQRHRPSSAF